MGEMGVDWGPLGRKKWVATKRYVADSPQGSKSVAQKGFFSPFYSDPRHRRNIRIPHRAAYAVFQNPPTCRR